MDVVLHIGAHRTASSALQHHMSRNRASFADKGVVYWGPKITRGGLFRGAIGSVDGVLPWQVRRFGKRCALRAEAVRQTGATHLMISDENMMGSLRAALEFAHLYRDAGRRVSAYAHGFKQHRVTIAMCVRDYSDWWTSAIAFRLPRGGPVPRTDRRELLVTQPRRWRHVVEDIAKTLPDARLVVWSYEASAHAPHLMVEELTGVASADDNTPAQNKRPTVPELHALMAACDIDPDSFEWPGGHFMPFAAHEAEALRAQYQEDLAWLRAGAGGFADYFDAPLAKTEAPTDLGRGTPDDGEHRHLA